MEASNDYENSTWAAEEILQYIHAWCEQLFHHHKRFMIMYNLKTWKNKNMSLSFYSKESEPEHLAIALKWTYLLILHLDHNFTKFYS